MKSEGTEMQDKTFVVDASVVIKWFSQEKYSDIAVKLLNSHVNRKVKLITPELLLYEIMNALRYSKLPKNDMIVAINDLIDVQLQFIVHDNTLIKKTIEHALEWDITCYDASYTALADLSGIKLVTADDKLFVKVKDKRLILHLKDVFEKTI